MKTSTPHLNSSGQHPCARRSQSISARRSGFSLVELLVVITLIIMIMALAAGAFFRVRASQNRIATEATMVKLNALLDARIKAINDQVRSDSTHPGYLAAFGLCNGNSQAARAIWTYARMKNELPMTAAEATTGVQIGSYTLQPQPKFLTEFQGIGGIQNQDESAACFYVAISTPSAVQTSSPAMTALDQQTGDVLVGGKSFRCVKDAWGTPIAFIRHCYHPELNTTPYVNTSKAVVDPYYPEANKNLASVYDNWSVIRINTPGFAAMPGNYAAGQNHVSTFISAGPNRNFDGSPFGVDDIVSFRLRRDGARGD